MFNIISGVNNAAVTLDSGNPNRIGLYIFNNTPVPLLLGFGFSPTSSGFSDYLAVSGLYEMPTKLTTTVIYGYCIGSGAAGQVFVTEVP